MKIQKLFAVVAALLVMSANATEMSDRILLEGVVVPQPSLKARVVGKLYAAKDSAVNNAAKAKKGVLFAGNWVLVNGKLVAVKGATLAQAHPYVAGAVAVAAVAGLGYGAYKWYSNRCAKNALRELQEKVGVCHKGVLSSKQQPCYFYKNGAMHFDNVSVVRPAGKSKYGFCCEAIDGTNAETIKNSGLLVKHDNGKNYVCHKCALHIAKARPEVAAQLIKEVATVVRKSPAPAA